MKNKYYLLVLPLLLIGFAFSQPVLATSARDACVGIQDGTPVTIGTQTEYCCGGLPSASPSCSSVDCSGPTVYNGESCGVSGTYVTPDTEQCLGAGQCEGGVCQ